jgi:hypothetical protein
MECSVRGCPCFYHWKPGHPVRPERADDMDVSVVLARKEEPGIGCGLSHHDKYRVFLRLEEHGFSARCTALTLGCTPRTIVRWRSRVRDLEHAR